MSEVIAIFPGSFDPFTKGHKDIVQRASKMFDKVFVLVATNPNKKPMFSSCDRVCMIDESLRELTNVTTTISSMTLTVWDAEALKASVIIRGIRNAKDIEYEMELASINKTLAPHIETVFIPCSDEFKIVSSSAYKAIVRLGDGAQWMVDNHIDLMYDNKQEVR